MITPADALALVELLDALPAAARAELLSRYCPDCGEICPCECEPEDT